jgi:hypothetical protein
MVSVILDNLAAGVSHEPLRPNTLPNCIGTARMPSGIAKWTAIAHPASSTTFFDEAHEEIMQGLTGT